jgi:uncharacterized membrane protein YfcA
MMSIGGVIGAIVGAVSASFIDPAYLRIGFGLMLLIGGIPSFLRSGREVLAMIIRRKKTS